MIFGTNIGEIKITHFYPSTQMLLIPTSIPQPPEKYVIWQNQYNTNFDSYNNNYGTEDM